MPPSRRIPRVVEGVLSAGVGVLDCHALAASIQVIAVAHLNRVELAGAGEVDLRGCCRGDVVQIVVLELVDVGVLAWAAIPILDLRNTAILVVQKVAVGQSSGLELYFAQTVILAGPVVPGAGSAAEPPGFRPANGANCFGVEALASGQTCWWVSPGLRSLRARRGWSRPSR